MQKTRGMHTPQYQCSRALCRILARVALASLAMLLQTSPARCQAAEERYKVGVYVTSIHAIDAAAGTYAADLWIRSVGTWPRGTRFKPWNSLTQTA